MNAADVMSKTPLAIRGDAPLAQALRLMLDNHVSGLPVIDEASRPVGILTEGDLLRRAELGTAGAKPGFLRMFFTPDRLAGDYVLTHGRRISELMTTPVVSVEETTPLDEVAVLMRKHRVRRLPVTRNGALVGIVSRADMIRALFNNLEKPAGDLGDDAIRERIEAEFDSQPLLLRRSVSVSVTGGAVDLDGVVFDMRQRDAAQVVAENVPGVKSVENRIVVVDPSSGLIVMDPAVDGAAD